MFIIKYDSPPHFKKNKHKHKHLNRLLFQLQKYCDFFTKYVKALVEVPKIKIKIKIKVKVKIKMALCNSTK